MSLLAMVPHLVAAGESVESLAIAVGDRTIEKLRTVAVAVGVTVEVAPLSKGLTAAIMQTKELAILLEVRLKMFFLGTRQY